MFGLPSKEARNPPSLPSSLCCDETSRSRLRFRFGAASRRGEPLGLQGGGDGQE